jgi:hypothetical protein
MNFFIKKLCLHSINTENYDLIKSEIPKFLSSNLSNNLQQNNLTQVWEII